MTNSKTATIVLGLLAFAVLRSATAAELPLIRYAQGQFGAGIGELPYTIAQNKGFFAREGIRVEKMRMTEGNAGSDAQGYIPAIERNGRFDIMSRPNGQFVQVVMNGSDAVAIASQNANPVYSIIVRPEIKTWADLKGKEITFTAPWDAITLSARKVLKNHGLAADDYKIKSIAGTEARMACLKAGECAAVIIGQPADIDAIKEGFHRLGYTSEAGPILFNVEVVTRAWAREHKDTLVRYLRADAAAMRFIHDPKNKAEVAKTLADLTHEPPAVVDEMMKNFEDPNMHPLSGQAEVNLPAFQHVLDLIQEFEHPAKPLPTVARLADTSYGAAAGIK